MDIGETTVVKEEARDEFLIEVKGANESSQVTQRELVVHQTELPVDHFGEKRNGQIAVLLADLEVCILGVFSVLHYGNWLVNMMHDRVVVISFDNVICNGFH